MIHIVKANEYLDKINFNTAYAFKDELKNSCYLNYDNVLAIYEDKHIDIVVFVLASFVTEKNIKKLKVDYWNYYPLRKSLTYTHSLTYRIPDNITTTVITQYPEIVRDCERTIKSLAGLVYPNDIE